MKIVVLSCSLNPNSRSAVLGQQVFEDLQELGQDAQLIDLREKPLPFCNASDSYGDANAIWLKKQLIAADAVLMGVPIYNFTVNAAAKNAIELTGRDAWSNKIVGFFCSAGGRGSYMSLMPTANSLMLDFRCLIVPRFVYATKDDVDNGQIVNDKVRSRVTELCQTTIAIGEGLHAVGGLATRATEPLR